MIVELGHLALILAFCTALLQMIVPFAGAHRRDAGLMALGGVAAQVQVVLLCLSFAALMWAFVTSDFSVALVQANSHTAKPMLYKISGVWGNHEGSMLLWCLILALFVYLVALFTFRFFDS